MKDERHADIKRIAELLEHKYGDENMGAFALICKDHRKSVFYDGDGMTVLNGLIDEVGEIIARCSDTGQELRALTTNVISEIAHCADVQWQQLHPGQRGLKLSQGGIGEKKQNRRMN